MLKRTSELHPNKKTLTITDLLPEDMLLEIAFLLPNEDRKRLLFVSKIFYGLIYQNFLNPTHRTLVNFTKFIDRQFDLLKISTKKYKESQTVGFFNQKRANSDTRDRYSAGSILGSLLTIILINTLHDLLRGGNNRLENYIRSILSGMMIIHIFRDIRRDSHMANQQLAQEPIDKLAIDSFLELTNKNPSFFDVNLPDLQANPPTHSQLNNILDSKIKDISDLIAAFKSYHQTLTGIKIKKIDIKNIPNNRFLEKLILQWNNDHAENQTKQIHFKM